MYLLDAIHEDLNRVKKKEYVEPEVPSKPSCLLLPSSHPSNWWIDQLIDLRPVCWSQEAEGRPDAVVAKIAWEKHLIRNRSIVVDNLHGQLKTKVVCPDCKRVAVTFDAMSCLQLPLPKERVRTLRVRCCVESTIPSLSRPSGHGGNTPRLLCAASGAAVSPSR